jgi:hypothetical protein
MAGDKHTRTQFFCYCMLRKDTVYHTVPGYRYTGIIRVVYRTYFARQYHHISYCTSTVQYSTRILNEIWVFTLITFYKVYYHIISLILIRNTYSSATRVLYTLLYWYQVPGTVVLPYFLPPVVLVCFWERTPLIISSALS